ncbi:MAG: carbohydrate kinase family protein [Halobacteriaceae archaeon]
MPSSPVVVGVGNALVDHTFHLTNLPEPDGGAYVMNRERGFGGVETNVVTNLAGLDIETGLIARVGTDGDGEAVREHLAGLPVDDSRVRQVAGDETSYTHVLTDPDGQRVILGGGDSTLNLRLDADDRTYLEGASVAMSSAYAPRSVLETLATSDPLFVFDLAGRFEDLEHRGLTRDALLGLLDDIELFVANMAAARSLFEGADATADTLADRLRSRGVNRAAITRGRDGAVLAGPAGVTTVPAVDVEVVDTTGAGDAFTAGLIASWLLGEATMTSAGRFAAAAAAATCRVRGAHAEPPDRETVMALLDQAGGAEP